MEFRSAELQDDGTTIELVVVTEHGTYVKEAIGGDDGKTEPNLAQLLDLEACHCAELDVLAILDESGTLADPEQAPAAKPVFGAGL